MYRTRRRTCPACASSMEEIAVPLTGGPGAEIDLCNSCGGVYLEFFDGEPTECCGACSRRG